MMIKSSEYYSRYNNLSNMIIQAYIIRYMIESIGEQEPFPLGYIDEILKYMFGLTIWQIYCDEDDKANTIQHLSHDINGKNAKLPKIYIKKKLKTHLNWMRNEYLAHNDKEKKKLSNGDQGDKVRIEIKALSALLDGLREQLNSLCRPDLDSRVSEITDKKLALLREEICSSFDPLLSRANRIQGESANA